MTRPPHRTHLSDLSKDILEHGDIDALGQTTDVEVVSLVLGDSVSITTSAPSVRSAFLDTRPTETLTFLGRLVDRLVGRPGPRLGALGHRFGEQETWTSLVPFVGIGLGHRQGRYLAKLRK